MGRFEEVRHNAQGLNKEVIDTMVAVANAGLPGYGAEEILQLSRMPRQQGADRNKYHRRGVQPYNWRFNFDWAGEVPQTTRDNSVNLLTPDGRPLTFRIDSADLPGGGRTFDVRTVSIEHEAPVDIEGYGGAARTVQTHPGRTWIRINSPYDAVTDEERDRRNGVVDRMLARNPNTDIERMNSDSVVIAIGPDGHVSSVEVGSMSGDRNMKLATSFDTDSHVRKLLAGIAGAARATAAPAVPDFPPDMAF
ncbi:hypothetical protein IRY61_02765 [Candidatus Saccharibacteria bacterium]|nr:hypothetical protein [Candidatus Saccharibacteria bacterium]